MYIAKGTKVNVASIDVVLEKETGYMKLIEQVEKLLPYLKVTGFRFISNKEMNLLTVRKEEGDYMLIPKGTEVSFIADGSLQVFQLEMDSTMDMIEESILEWFTGYREESLCISGVNYMFPNITNGYAIVEGKMAERLEEIGKKTYFSLKNIKDILKLGIRKGDTLHLKDYSSFTIASVDFGNNMVCLSLE